MCNVKSPSHALCSNCVFLLRCMVLLIVLGERVKRIVEIFGVRDEIDMNKFMDLYLKKRDSYDL